MILKIDNFNNFTITDIEKLKKCSKELNNDGIVAFPTETVYGIGASIFSERGIKKIFKVKRRPQDNPLIAHISSLTMIEKLVEFSDEIQKYLFFILAKKLWPGPISFVLNAKPDIPKIATAGLKTIAVRMPDNPIALKLIELTQSPVVAPSANLSGKPSATTASDVYHDFKENIPYILDGGKTNIGIESTVVDLTEENIVILRPGFITKEDLDKIIKNSDILNKFNNIKDNSLKVNISKRLEVKYLKNNLIQVKSPGMKYTHYKPDAKTFLFDIKYLKVKQFNKIKNLIEEIIQNNDVLFLILSKEKENLINFIKTHIKTGYNIKYFESINSFESFLDINKNRYNKKNSNSILIIGFNNIYSYASYLYYIFRLSDKKKIKHIFLQKPDNRGFGISLNNRLIKASDVIIK